MPGQYLVCCMEPWQQHPLHLGSDALLLLVPTRRLPPAAAARPAGAGPARQARTPGNGGRHRPARPGEPAADRLLRCSRSPSFLSLLPASPSRCLLRQSVVVQVHATAEPHLTAPNPPLAGSDGREYHFVVECQVSSLRRPANSVASACLRAVPAAAVERCI